MSQAEQKDVIAVGDDNKVIWASGPHGDKDAEAVIKMAVMRQGVSDRFFTTCEHGKYVAGDLHTPAA